MTQQADDIKAIEELLRGHGVAFHPVDPEQAGPQDLRTADGRFTIEPARNMSRLEQMITLYRTDTGEAVPTDTNESVKRLRKRYPTAGDFALTYPQLSGKLAFTLGVRSPDGQLVAPQPILKQEVAGELCWLNQESENFGYIRSLGVRSTCRSIAHRMALGNEEHIRTKHGVDVWRLIERDKEQADKDEDQGRIKQLIQLVLQQRGIDTSKVPGVVDQIEEQVQGTEEAPLYISDKPAKGQVNTMRQKSR